MSQTVLGLDFDSRNSDAGGTYVTRAHLEKGASLKNGALRLDGRNDYAVIEADDALAIESGAIAFTFNADRVSGERTLVSRDSKNFDGGGHLTIWIEDGRLKVRLQSDSESYTLETDARAIRAHRDYDVVFGFGEQGMSLTLDGQVVDTNAYTGGLAGNDEPLTLGASQMFSSDGKANHLRDYFDGEIKGFRMTQNQSNSSRDVVIAHEDFENGASGWSNGRRDHSPALTDYLGGFGAHESTKKTYDIPADAESVTLTFDFLELDSWDGESFKVVIDGKVVNVGAFVVNHNEGDRAGEAHGIAWSTEAVTDGHSDLGGDRARDHWSNDQIHKVTLEIPRSAISGDRMTVEFKSHLNQDRHDESFGIDNLKIVGHLPGGDDCAVTETLLHEDFDGLHDPEQSDAVVGHTRWDVEHDALFTNGHEDGCIDFAPVQLNGHVAGAFSFDIKADAVEAFEASGHFADRLEVQLRVDGGHWITIDTLRRDGHSDEFVGDQSGFRFGDDGFTTLSYVNDNIPAGAQSVQFRLFSHITAGDEIIRIDNVKVTADKDECDACDGLKIDFNDLAKGTIVSGQYENVTISAVANGGKNVRLEAEDMHRDGFHKTHGDHASGGELVFADAHANAHDPATLSAHFSGHTGKYDLKLRIQDEKDGQSTVTVKIGGETFDIVLDRDSDGWGSNNDGFSTFTIPGVHVEAGERIELSSFRDGGERVRIDRLDFEAVDVPGDNRAMIFDTDHITGGDHDLAAGDGKVLIISEDGDAGDPDDNAAGGAFHFDFDPGVTVAVSEIVVVDTEEGGKVEAFDADGASLGVVDLPRIADGAVASVPLDFAGVAKLVVTLNGSGAIDDLCYEKEDAPQLGSLSGRYFCDTDNDDVDDGQAVDPGEAGVLVTLLDANGDPVLDAAGAPVTTVTGAQGEYRFADLPAGVYGVRFTDPDGVLAGKQLVAPNVGDDDAVDSDAIGDIALSEIADIVVAAGADTPDNDAGAEQTAALGDRVFLDADRDGAQDAGEAGVGGVTVTLTGGGADGVIGTADDTTETEVTDADGGYLFEGLNPGEEYKVTFSAIPAGLAFTTANAAGVDDAADSDADPANGMTQVVTLAPGETNRTLDAGLVLDNVDPSADPDMAKLCSNTATVIDVLANDDDPDGDALSVIAIEGQAVVAGQSVTLDSGAVVTLNADGTLGYDLTGADDFDGLLIGEEAPDAFAYTVSDGQGGEDTAQVDVTVCGDVNLVETIDNTDPEVASYSIQTITTGGRPPVTERTEVTLDFEDDAFDISLGGVAGPNTFTFGYCIDRDRPINSGPSDALIYTSTDDIPDVNFDGGSVVDKEENLDLLNWVLNQGFEDSFSFDDIQSAIWEIIDDQGGVDVDGGTPGTQLSAGAQSIVDQAFANGKGFAPDSADGDVLGLVIQPFLEVNGVREANGQVYIVGVELEPCDCLM